MRELARFLDDRAIRNVALHRHAWGGRNVGNHLQNFNALRKLIVYEITMQEDARLDSSSFALNDRYYSLKNRPPYCSVAGIIEVQEA